MADERAPAGGNSAPILRKLEAMDAEIKGLNAKVDRLSAKGETSRSAAGRSKAEGRTATESTRAIDAESSARQRSAKAANLQRDAIREADRAVAQVDRTYGASSGASERFRLQTAALSQTTASGSQAMRRHGALTTEFLSAAARGDATLSEFRFQIGATIAKFAGWTAASAAVFGVLGALRELGRGALDSINSVNLLTRVINHVDKDQAAKGIGGLAERFNLPIEDVGAAVFQFAKVPENNTVPKALKASEAALFAVKTGELDAAEAGRLLIAIQQGLGISSVDLVGKYDQINQAQNKFGVNIQNTTAGLAKSIGAFKAAGGDFSQALAIITTASLVSGRSGVNIGTALQRSASLIRRPKNQQQLREFGIDPTQDIGKIYTQAIAAARHLGGRQRLSLATALSTPQLAPYLVGVLNRPDLYEQVRKQTSPGASKGSAQRELDKQLKSAGEQLHKVLTEVQVLGGELARLGAFDAFGLMVRSLSTALTILNSLIRLVNELPAPMRKAGVYALEFYAALRLARRFNVGGALIGTRAEGAASFLQQPPLQRGRRQLIRGYREEAQVLTNERERVTAGLGGLGTRQELAHRQVLAATAEAKALPAGSKERILAAGKVKAAEGELLAIQAQIAKDTNEQAFLAQRIAQNEETIAIAQKTRNAAMIEQFGNRPINLAGGTPNTGSIRALQQVYGPAGRPRDPATGKFVPLGNAPPPIIPGGGVAGESAEIAKLRKQAEAGVARDKAYSERVARYRANVSRVLPSFLGLGATGNAATAATAKAAGAVAGAGGALRNLPATVGRLGGTLAGFARSIGSFIGPFELLIADYFIVSYAMDQVKAQGDKLNKQADFIPHDAEASRKQIAGLRSNLKDYQNASPYISLENTLTGVDPEGQTRANIAAQQILLRNQRRNPITSGRANYLLTAGTIANQLNRAKRARDLGQITVREYDKALGQALEDIKGGTQLSAHDRAALTRKANEARAGTAPLRKLGTDQLAANITSYLGIAGSAGQSRGRQESTLRAAVANLSELGRKIELPTASPQDLEKLAGAEDQVIKAFIDHAQQTLTSGLLYARSDAQRKGAYRRAIQFLQRTPVHEQNVQIQKDERGIRGQRENTARLEAQKKVLEALSPLSVEGGSSGLNIEKQIQDLDARIRESKVKGQQKHGDLDEARKLRERFRRAVRDQIKQLADQRFDEGQGSADLEAQIAAARQGPDQVRATSILLHRAGAKVRALIQRYGRENDKTRQAILEETNLRNQLAQAQSDRIAAEFDVQIARTTDPERIAQLNVQKARAILSRAKGDQRLAALAQYYQALQAADQARLDVANAEFELQKSLTGDPIKQAAIQIRADEFALAHAKGQAERLHAQATLNNDRRSYRQARQQDKFDNIEYLADIGKIDKEVELSRLQALLKTIKGNKDLRREIQRRIFALKKDLNDSTQFDLDVGNIKLPTAYEIRRAVLGGVNGPQVNVTSNPTVQVSVTDPSAAYKVGQVIDDTLGTATRSAMRAAGYRGGS